MRTNKRAVGVVLDKENNKILLIHRFKDGREYFVFPGGGVEDEETIEEALIREMKEEACLDVEIDRHLFEFINHPVEMGWTSRNDYFCLITKYSGEACLGGPEKDRMNEKNQYYLEWHDIEKLSEMENLKPDEGRERVIQFLNGSTP